jgi:tripartite-type tricarboxylate transporter receptor subunit TctC
MKKKLYAILTAFIMSFATMNYAWSTDLIEIVVPTPPGGAVDMTARAVSKDLTSKGINNLVNYYPGAAGEIAIGHALKKKDNVILIGSSANFVFLDVANNRTDSIVKTFQLFGPSVVNSMMFVVAPSSEFKSFNDMIVVAKKQELPCGVSNSHGDILLTRINKQYGTKFTPVMYKGTGQMIPNVIGGQLTCAYDQTAPYIAQGDKVKWLATSAKEPIKQGVPTISSVLPKFSFETWYAAGIPNNSNLLQRIDIIDVLKYWKIDKQAVQPLLDAGFAVSPTTVDLNVRVARETEQYQQLLKK